MNEPLGANLYVTHCIHGLDLRIYPRCYMCKPWGTVPGDYPVPPAPSPPVCSSCGVGFSPNQPYHVHFA